MKTCPECDTPTAADAATCVVCGARFDQGASEPIDDVGAERAIPSRADPALHPDLPPDAPSDQPIEEADVPTESTTQAAPTADDPADDPAVGAPEAPPTGDAPEAPPTGDAIEDAAEDPTDHSSIPPPSHDQVAWPASVPPAGGQAPPRPPGVPPAPDAIALDESVRNWGLLAHVSGLVASSLVGMGFVGPLIVWVLKRDDHPFVAHNAAEALNFQLSMLLYGILLVVASLPVITLLLTLPLAFIGFLLWLVLPIVAAVKASRGESWTYPITIGFVRP